MTRRLARDIEVVGRSHWRGSRLAAPSGGIHQCVGMLLARREGECVLSALARKARAMAITGAARRRYNNALRGLASLPLRLEPA